MILKIKGIGLVMSMLLVLCGLTGSAASAATFTSESHETVLTGSQEQQIVISATGLSISCTTAFLRSTEVATSFESVTLVPTLTGCSAQLGPFKVNATITGFGHYGEAQKCHLVLYANGTGDLVCPAGVESTLDAGTCTVHMPGQSGIKTFSFINTKVNGVDALTVNINITNVSGTHTDGFGCPFNGGGAFKDTSAAGVGLITGHDTSGDPVGVTWD